MSEVRFIRKRGRIIPISGKKKPHIGLRVAGVVATAGAATAVAGTAVRAAAFGERYRLGNKALGIMEGLRVRKRGATKFEKGVVDEIFRRGKILKKYEQAGKIVARKGLIGYGLGAATIVGTGIYKAMNRKRGKK